MWEGNPNRQKENNIMTEYTLHDAPPPKRTTAQARNYFPEDLLEQLRENPGQWAIGGSANNTAQANYWRKQLKPEGFKIVTRKQDDGTHDYWITYEGGDDE